MLRVDGLVVVGLCNANLLRDRDLWYVYKNNTRMTPPIMKKLTHMAYILRVQVPTTQLAEVSIYPKFVELTADVLEIFL